MPYSRVLVATDFSESALLAAQLARRVAGDEASYRALHVLSAPEQVGVLQPAEIEALRAFEAEALTSATVQLDAWVKKAALPRATAVVRRGAPARELEAEARDFGAGLVALGARGMSRFERLLVGSNARAAVRHVLSGDVLVARGAAGTERVLVAVDFHAASQRAVEAGLAFARAGAQVLLLHVLEPGPFAEAAAALEPAKKGHAARREAARQELASWNQRHLDGRAIEVLVEGKPVAEVASFAAEHDIDLVVVGSVGHGAIERAVLGSVAEAVVERAPCSVLVARGGAGSPS